MALMVTNPGQYVLGGISAPRRGISEEFQAGLQANIGRQDARQVMQAREQAMGIAASQEARAQQQFEFQQQQAQAAAAQAAARQRALSALTTGLANVGAGAPTGVPGTTPVAPVAPPSPRAGLAFPGVTGRTPFSLGVPVPGAGPAAGTPLSMGQPSQPDGVQVASLDPMDAFRLAFEARPDLFGGGVQVADASGVLPAGAAPSRQQELANYAASLRRMQGYYSREDLAAAGFSAEEIADFEASFVRVPADAGAMEAQYGTLQTPQGGPVAVANIQRELAARLQDPDLSAEDRRAIEIRQRALDTAVRAGYGVADAVTDAMALAQRLGTRAIEYGVGVPLSAVSPELGAQVFGMVPEWERTAAGLAATGETIPPALLSEQVSAQTGTQPISDAAATAEAATTAEEAAPTKQTPWGGLRLSFGTPVEMAFSANKGRGSETYVTAPENIYRDAELIDRQRQRLTLLAQFYQQTGDVGQLVGVMNQLDELSLEQRYLDGMLAIVGIQRADFGAVQALFQERYRGQEVEVRPYTDGTVEIFLDGQSVDRMSWQEMATGLRGDYDRGYIEQQQALAAEAQERSRFAFETFTKEEARTAGAIAEYESRQDLQRALDEGELRQVSTEPPVYNMVVDGRVIPVTVEAVTEGTGRNAVTRYVIRRLDTTAAD